MCIYGAKVWHFHVCTYSVVAVYPKCERIWQKFLLSLNTKVINFIIHHLLWELFWLGAIWNYYISGKNFPRKAPYNTPCGKCETWIFIALHTFFPRHHANSWLLGDSIALLLEAGKCCCMHCKYSYRKCHGSARATCGKLSGREVQKGRCDTGTENTHKQSTSSSPTEEKENCRR